MYSSVIKVFIDFILSLVIILLTLPIIICVTLLLLVTNNGNPFFLQSRPGKHGKIFKIIKFKTMIDKKDENDELLPDEMRITSVGRIIRKTSLDELLQFVNVIKGDMSVVGPRPLLPEYLSLYNDYQKRRHEVKPGITGWAQVNGRNSISWEKKFEYDIWYVDNISIKTDMKILFLTFVKIFKSEGISSETSVTMEKFKGN